MTRKAVLLSLLMVFPLVWAGTNADAAEMTHDKAIKLVRQAYCRVLERQVDESGLVTYASKLERGDWGTVETYVQKQGKPKAELQQLKLFV
jgi:hypothetical protein